MAEYNVKIKRYNGTSYDGINPETIASQVKFTDGYTVQDCRSVVLTGTLVGGIGWVGTSAPYTQTISVSGISSSSIGVIGLPKTATDEQWEAAELARLRLTNADTNQITVIARDEKPLIDIPIEIIVTGLVE